MIGETEYITPIIKLYNGLEVITFRFSITLD